MIITYLKGIKESIKAVPAVKYSLGVAGLIMTVALVKSFNIDYRVSVIGVIILLVLMVALFVFSRLTKIGNKHLYFPSMLLLYSFTILTISVAVLFFTSVFFEKPLKLNFFEDKEKEISKDTVNNLNKPKLQKSIGGRIIDESSKVDIDSVEIIVNGLNSIYYSDSYGNFAIPLDENKLVEIINLKFYKKGYRSKTINTTFQEIPLRILLNREK